MKTSEWKCRTIRVERKNESEKKIIVASQFRALYETVTQNTVLVKNTVHVKKDIKVIRYEY